MTDRIIPSSWKLKVLAIYSGVSHEVVSQRLRAGEIVGCGSSVPALTQADIDQTPRIVAQMGPEPFVQAMLANPDFDIIVGGRSYDPAPYIAWCAYNALVQKAGSIQDLGKAVMGGFAHMGKLLECGAQFATPKSSAALSYVYQDGTFDVIPLEPGAKSIPRTAAAHALYENARPDILKGPGGHMDLTKAVYEQLDDGRSVRVQGTTFVRSRSRDEAYTVKLEGGKVTGFRTLFIGSYCDPILIGQLDELFLGIKDYVKMQHRHVTESWDVDFHVYGLNEDQSGSRSPKVLKNALSMPGIFIVGEAIAQSQEVATSVASTARIACIHGPYKGQKATAGNLGFGHGGKFEYEAHECTEFSVYHLMNLKEGEEGAVHALSHEAGLSNKDTTKGLFHWTETVIGKAEELLQNGLTHTNGLTNGTSKRRSVPPSTLDISNPRTLSDIATVVRSKNAGPFDITVDVLFDSQAVYQLVKSSGVLTADVIAKLYSIPVSEIIWSGFYDAALAFKATFPRKRNGKIVAAGGFMENDVHASQHHVELLTLELGEPFLKRLAEGLKLNK